MVRHQLLAGYCSPEDGECAAADSTRNLSPNVAVERFEGPWKGTVTSVIQAQSSLRHFSRIWSIPESGFLAENVVEVCDGVSSPLMIA